jgi:hypothetical protein
MNSSYVKQRRFSRKKKEKEIAAKIARLLEFQKVVMQNNQMYLICYFWKKLLLDQGFTVGRLDSPYKG